MGTMQNSRSLTLALSLSLFGILSGCDTEVATTSLSQPQTTPGLTHSVAGEVVNAAPPQVALTASPDKPDAIANAAITKYIGGIAAQGFSGNNQGVWMQTGDTLLANYQGTVPLPAASLTKVATTLAALLTFGPDHEFITAIATTGTLKNGVLQGDLIVSGGEDPFFVWEEAIALGNTLNQLGIKRITGNLVITGKFYMNYETDPKIAGNLLLEGLNAQIWSEEAENQYHTLPANTPRPQVIIDGSIQVLPSPPANLKPLIRHHSLPLAELLKKMNQYSNNLMADMIANSVGGAQVVAQKASEAAGVPANEIQLVNGSGLSPQNRISPRAVVGLFRAIEQYLKPYQMTVADVFSITGQDEGVLAERNLPPLTIVKSGTLDEVSALGGVLNTQKQGTLWFTIMNGGTDIEGFRLGQETLLKSFLTQWGTVSTLPNEFQPNASRKTKASRQEIIK